VRKESEKLYVREDCAVLVHGNGPDGTNWCVVDISAPGVGPNKVLAMFAELEDSLLYAESKKAGHTVHGRTCYELRG